MSPDLERFAVNIAIENHENQHLLQTTTVHDQSLAN